MYMFIKDSGVSSGLLRLIPREIRDELASIYFKLECHNYGFLKVRAGGTNKKYEQNPQKEYSCLVGVQDEHLGNWGTTRLHKNYT